jgi:hypothetical protein
MAVDAKTREKMVICQVPMLHQPGVIIELALPATDSYAKKVLAWRRKQRRKSKNNGN